MKRINFFRKKYPKFIYQKYSYRVSGNNLEIFFNFKIEPSIFFRPKIVIKNINKSKIKKVGDRVLNNLIFHLGLMEIPSYWKATCSSPIEIAAAPLNSGQIKWWKDLIINGMGQFFYENKIDFTQSNFLEISSYQGNSNFLKKNVNSKPLNLPITEIWPSKIGNDNFDEVLVPIGGGKDSIVTLELLKKAKKNIRYFSLNPTPPCLKIIKIGKGKHPIIIKRKIDSKLLELNRKGFLNGHTPFSAYLAFLSVLVGVIFDLKYITFSNERSSNEGNVKYLGKIINHQWSKSFDFEKKFRKYSKKYLAKDIEYFSFLRPLYDIQIAKLFSHFTKYFNAFLSCNEAFKTASETETPTKKWCDKCPKCLFVFATLYPFVNENKLIKIFGQNLFKKKNLLPIMEELTGQRKFKPFECVGTKKESLVGFYLSLKKSSGGKLRLPFLLKYFKNKILPTYPNLKKEAKKIMNAWDNRNNLPKEFKKILKGHQGHNLK